MRITLDQFIANYCHPLAIEFVSFQANEIEVIDNFSVVMTDGTVNKVRLFTVPKLNSENKVVRYFVLNDNPIFHLYLDTKSIEELISNPSLVEKFRLV